MSNSRDSPFIFTSHNLPKKRKEQYLWVLTHIMNTINFNGQNLHKVPKTKKDIYKSLNYITNLLNIKKPDLVFAPICRALDEPALEGLCVQKKEVSSLKNDLVIINIEMIKKEPNPDFLIIGTLAHELRHLWQYSIDFTNNLLATTSVDNPAEIDADAFAAYIISCSFNINIEEAVKIYNYDMTLYPYSIEKAFINSICLNARLNAAKKLKETYNKWI